MVRRRSTVRFRKGAPGGFHTSPVSRFTYGSDIVGLVAAAAGGRADGRRGVFAVPVTGFRAGLAACGTVVVSVSGLTRRAGWWRGCWPAVRIPIESEH